MKKLSSNQDLHEYLVHLASELKRCGAQQLSETVAVAGHHAMPTEFLGESRLALREVLVRAKGLLSASDYSDVQDVLKQIDDALDKHNRR
jgi:hypothetical protein